MRNLLAFLIAMAFSACVASAQFFPDGSLDSKGHQFKAQWYSAQLAGLQEPSLFALTKDPAAESYRFLWLRSFHHPVAVRLDVHPDGTGVLITKISSGAGGYRPGTLTQNTSRVLTRQETQSALSQVEQLHFWTLPNPVNDQKGTDGSQWIVEGVKHGRYHVVDRWTPTTGPVRQLGSLFAFDLAKLTVPQSELY